MEKRYILPDFPHYWHYYIINSLFHGQNWIAERKEMTNMFCFQSDFYTQKHIYTFTHVPRRESITYTQQQAAWNVDEKRVLLVIIPNGK